MVPFCTVSFLRIEKNSHWRKSCLGSDNNCSEYFFTLIILKLVDYMMEKLYVMLACDCEVWVDEKMLQCFKIGRTLK